MPYWSRLSCGLICLKEYALYNRIVTYGGWHAAGQQSEIQTILATKGRPQKMKEEPSAPVKEEEKP